MINANINTTYALISAIESDDTCLNKQTKVVTTRRLFEQEAINCFTTWRQNGGWLKDIPIYTVCPTRNTISDKTIEIFKDLNVTYIEDYYPSTEFFSSGFINIPFVGSILERMLREDVLIKVDLDMSLIQPLPIELINKVLCKNEDDKDIIICGQYDNYCSKQQRTSVVSNPFDTSLIISNRKSAFYNTFYTKCIDSTILDSVEWKAIKSQTGDYYLEEYVMDVLAKEDTKYNILPIQKYQIGEWYTPVSEFTDEELNNVYFWHEHIIYDKEYNKIKEKLDYVNRMKRIRLSE